MIVQHVDGIGDPRVEAYGHLGDPAWLRARGAFVAEGRLVVERAIAGGQYVVTSVLVSPAALAAMGPVLDGLPAETPVLVCPAADFAGITGYNIHRGCLAIVERPAEPAVETLLARPRTLVVTEAIANPDNMGGIFRNAAAFGAGAVLLDPSSCDPLYRKAIRTSMAATLAVPFARIAPWPAGLDRIREHGFVVAALTPREGAEPLPAFAARVGGSRVALLVGTEGAGLTEGALAHADAHVRIAIEAAVDSLNVAVAAGIALHALRGSLG